MFEILVLVIYVKCIFEFLGFGNPYTEFPNARCQCYRYENLIRNSSINTNNSISILYSIPYISITILCFLNEAIYMGNFLLLHVMLICLCEYKGERSNKCELGRLLQLILGCAVNCANKEEYIGRIMSMEESVQHVVMNAIQEVWLYRKKKEMYF